MMQRILHHCQQLAIVSRFGKQQAIGRKPGLLEARCVKIEPGYHPKDGRGRRAGGDAGEEQRRSRFFGEYRPGWRYVVQATDR